jgi:DNA sulfur modification protein DndE
LQLAYRWGYPLIALATNNRETYGSTINAFYKMKTAADEKSQRDRGFNAETLYSAGALDLAKEPMVFSMPKVGDRYVVFPVQDAWGNIDNVIGTRTEGNDGGNYLISGPGWKGSVPKGVKHYRVHTNVAFLPGRTMVNSPEDARTFAATVQDHITLTPLSRWGKGAPNPNRDSLKDPLPADPSKNYNAILTSTSINDYFNELNALLVGNPPYDYDKPVLEQFAKLGIGPGLEFDINRFGPAVRSAMEEFGRTDVPTTAKMYAEQGQDYRMSKLCCRFGTAYFERYYLLFGGLGGNLLEDAAYFWLTKDTSGARLDGNNKYVVRFEASQIPVTKAFWSLTLYDKDFYLPKDLPLNRHVRNSNSGMKLGPDGSLVIYLQADSPGPDKEDNWLPTPRDAYFCILRVYRPEGDILTGKWHIPDIAQAQ